jgi:signal transduction histidine kinase
LLTQLLYVVSNWGQYRRNDYLRYALYISLFILYILSIFPGEIFSGRLLEQAEPVTNVIKRPLAFLIYLVYFRFMDLFLELKEKYPGLHRQVIISNWAIGLFFFTEVFLAAAGSLFSQWGNYIYFGLSFFLFGLSVLFMIKAYRHKNILTITLLRGSVCVATGAFITNVGNIYSGLAGRSLTVMDYIPLFGGILLELFFFNLALAYKIVQEQNQLTLTQRLVIEQLRQNEQLAMEQSQIRNKIARDLHDEVGATLSGVTLFGELALRNISRNQFHDIDKYLHRISSECGQMAEKLIDIIWTTNTENVTLEKLFDHLQAYAKPICLSKKIELQFYLDDKIKESSFSEEVRNHLYLFCKEAINNAVKYSGGTIINLSVSKENDHYKIYMSDNGKGFDVNANYEGNGLKNMKSRADDMGGNCLIQSAGDKGTTIHLTLQAF